MHIENKGYGKYRLYFFIIIIIHKIFTICNYYLIKKCKNYMRYIQRNYKIKIRFHFLDKDVNLIM